MDKFILLLTKGYKTASQNNPEAYINYMNYKKFGLDKIKESNSNGKNINNGFNPLNEETKKQEYIYSYSIDEDTIKEEEKYDGYYGITTNLNGNIEDILSISKNRWEIEENFRILKSDFESGDIYLSREDRIKAHFTTCFLSLIIYRYLEKKLDYKYTASQVIDTLRNFDFRELKGFGYKIGRAHV